MSTNVSTIAPSTELAYGRTTYTVELIETATFQGEPARRFLMVGPRGAKYFLNEKPDAKTYGDDTVAIFWTWNASGKLNRPFEWAALMADGSWKVIR